MHSYNTRYASMNRSYNSSDDDDAEYVPHSRWVPTSNARRPITRSMIANTSAVQNTVRCTLQTFNNHSMTLRSSRR
jgi:hypothetical protein